METADLTEPGYWTSDEPDVRFNPVGLGTQEGLMAFVRDEPRLAGHVLVETSGSRETPKWIAVSKAAMLASAKAVNAHLEASTSDRWLLALPDFHVGGIGVYARGILAGISVSVFGGRWRGHAAEFVDRCECEEITLTALTPTQVFDLVQEKHKAPDQLRAVIVGGGRLDLEMGKAARSLGWPVMQSYGMTEAASQIATDSLGALDSPFAGDWLPVLPHWEVSVGDDDRLRIRGVALFSGMVTQSENGEWRFDSVNLDGEGWFVTADRVEIRNGPVTELRFLGRSDDLVKILGELVSLDRMRGRWAAILEQSGFGGTVVAVSDERREHQLIGLIEGVPLCQTVGEEMKVVFNAQVAPFERIDRVEWIAEMPRTAIGKIAYGKLKDQLCRGEDTG